VIKNCEVVHILNLASRPFCAHEDVGDSTDLVLSNATIRPLTIISNSSDFHESVQSGTQNRAASNDVSDESDSGAPSSIQIQPLYKSKLF